VGWVIAYIFSVFLCSHTGGYHPKEELAIFGYGSDRKVEKFKNPSIF
jgi:hypothetical protein